MAQIVLDIGKCDTCPLHKSERTPTPDSFEVAFDYYCGVNNRKIAGYIEKPGEMPEVPEWCPHKLK